MAKEKDPAPKRVALNMKASPQLRGRIDEAAAASGLSVAQEVERRLLESLRLEDQFGGRKTTAFLQLAASVIQDAEAGTGCEWQDDFLTWSGVNYVVRSLLDSRRPSTTLESELATLEASVFRLQRRLLDAVSRLNDAGIQKPNRLVEISRGKKPEEVVDQYEQSFIYKPDGERRLARETTELRADARDIDLIIDDMKGEVERLDHLRLAVAASSQTASEFGEALLNRAEGNAKCL
jgi:hypothetical protein